MADDWEPKFRYWVVTQRDFGWTCAYRTNWRWRARRAARWRARRGLRAKVVTR